MTLRPRATRVYFSRSIVTLGLAALAATACRPAARTIPEPAMSALIVHNTSQFDVNVFVLPTADGKPVWLATVPPTTTRSLPIGARALQSGGNLVVRTQSIGSSRTWTSNAVKIDDTLVAVLDLITDRAGGCADSRLFTADAYLAASVIY